jgi:hypothetical protein
VRSQSLPGCCDDLSHAVYGSSRLFGTFGTTLALACIAGLQCRGGPRSADLRQTIFALRPCLRSSP